MVLSAPTGSGKSTQVPQILIDAAQVQGDVVVLQPRRLAARLLAKRVAQERGCRLGEEVGYQIRFENVVGPNTRIRFVTEAILLRQILQDPALKGVGAVVFDEFHERHLTSDLSLSCALQSVQAQRPDLKIVVMSATLDIETLEGYLQPCARVEASGRMYPVTTRYMGAALNRDAAPVWERAAAAFRNAVREGGERRCADLSCPVRLKFARRSRRLSRCPMRAAYEVLPLHGELSPDAQDRAVSSGGRPKVIVSTNVAETSITIEGRARGDRWRTGADCPLRCAAGNQFYFSRADQPGLGRATHGTGGAYRAGHVPAPLERGGAGRARASAMRRR